jgi:hypothetical protein
LEILLSWALAEYLDLVLNPSAAELGRGLQEQIDTLAWYQITRVENPGGLKLHRLTSLAESGDVYRHWRYHRLVDLGQLALDILGQKSRHCRDPGSSLEHAPGSRSHQACTIEQPDVGSMAGDQIWYAGAARKPPAGKPPVGMDEIGLEAPHGRADRASKGHQEPGKAQRGKRREQGSLMKTAGIGHSLERRRSVPEAMEPKPPALFVSGRARGVRGNDLNLVTTLGGTFGDPRDKRSGRVARKPRVIVGDGKNAHRGWHLPHKTDRAGLVGYHGRATGGVES